MDVSKFWYLLLFVYDFIEDIGTNAPALNKSVLEDFSYFHANLLEATSITLKKNNKKSYVVEREDTIRIIQAALQHFVNTYSDIIHSEQDRETMIKQLKDIGLEGFIRNDLSSKSALQTSPVLTYLIRSGSLRICFCSSLKEERLPPYPIKR